MNQPDLFTLQDGIDFNEDSHSGKIFIIISKALQKFVLKRLRLRELLIIAALISLCVSNNVGPNFLPLPVVKDRATENPEEKRHDKASRTPSPTEIDSFRVPMMGQTQKRTAPEPQPQPLAATIKAGIACPADTRVTTTFSFPIPLFSSPLVSQPPGRAPPFI